MDPASHRFHPSGEDAHHDFEDNSFLALDHPQAHMSYITTTAQGQAPSTIHIDTTIVPSSLSNEPLPAWQDLTLDNYDFLLDASMHASPEMNDDWLNQLPADVRQPSHVSAYQYLHNVDVQPCGIRRVVSLPEDHRTQDSLYEEPENPRRSSINLPPQPSHLPPSSPFPQAENQPTFNHYQGPPERKSRAYRSIKSQPMPKKRDASTGSLAITRRTANALEQAIKEAEGESGWGWKLKEAGQSGPTFGETLEIEPMYNENRTPVKAELHGRFDVSRVHAGLISCDEGPVVHELQKRNIFQIRNISYSLSSDADEADFLMLFLNGKWERINKMFVKLVGKKNFGDSPATSETPLETRGKARQLKPAQRVNVFEQMRYDKTIGGFTCHDANYGDNSPLSHIYAQSHIEFRHATSGNRTKGYWRVENQSYYRLTLQLWAYFGTDVRDVDELRDSRDLILVAESTTGLLIVRGRPPGGREVASEKTATDRNVKTKASEENAMPSRTKRQKREHTPNKDDDEDELLEQPSEVPIPRHSRLEASGPDAAQGFQPALDDDHRARRYDTRKASRRTYEEAMSDSNEQGTSPTSQWTEFPSGSDQNASSPTFDFLFPNKIPHGQTGHNYPTENVARRTGNEGQQYAGGNDQQEGQHTLSLFNMHYPRLVQDDGSLVKIEDQQLSDLDGLDWYPEYHGTILPVPSSLTPAPSVASDSQPPQQPRDGRAVTQPASPQAASTTVAAPTWGVNSAAETARQLGPPPPVVVPEAAEQSNSNSDHSPSTSAEDASPQERRQVKPEVSGDDVFMGSVNFVDFIDDH